MTPVRIAALAALTLMASGCAGVRARQDLARLQSHLGMLEERVAQLERSPASYGAAGYPEPALGAPSGDATVTTTPKPAAAPARSSAKPSTREIQQALKNAGFYQGAIDGKMGPMTREAIKEFQRINGLTEDGVVGRRTWAQLKAYADLSASGGDATAAEPFK